MLHLVCFVVCNSAIFLFFPDNYFIMVENHRLQQSLTIENVIEYGVSIQNSFCLALLQRAQIVKQVSKVTKS